MSTEPPSASALTGEPFGARVGTWVYAAGVLFALVPLWSGELPMVDLPQHLHLISVLHRLDDPTTLYPRTFAVREGFTPYLGYYLVVHWLHWLLPLEMANRVFLSLVVGGLCLAAGALLRALGRPRWSSLLATPFVYGDAFAWGFVNFLAAMALSVLALALFVGSLTDFSKRRLHALGFGVALLGVLAFHIQMTVFLALALPLLWLTTRAEEEKGFERFRLGVRLFAPSRRAALAAAVPAVAVATVYAFRRLLEPAEVAPGVPWKAWGPLFSEQNLSFKSFAQNRAELFSTLGHQLRDGSDVWGPLLAGAVALAACGAARVPTWKGSSRESTTERLRLPLLLGLSLACFFLLPFDIRGLVYALNTRFSHLCAALAVLCVPALAARARLAFTLAAAAACGLTGIALARGYQAFAVEAAGLRVIGQEVGNKPHVMGLVFRPDARSVHHPVFLHAAAELARAGGGVPNFSFATTPHSPLRFRDDPPPTFPSEWRPDTFQYAQHGRAYDHFVIRGAHPRQIFGPLLDTELFLAAQEGTFFLVRRR